MDGQIDDALRRAREAWPGISLDAARFRSRVADLCEGDASRLGTLHTSDVFLALAILAQDPAALRTFEERILPEIGPGLARLKLDASRLADIRQAVRERLVLHGKLDEYGGRGPLQKWVRIVALRLALSGLRNEKEGAPLDEAAALPAPAMDPELDAIRARFRPELQRALAAGFSSLDPRDRTLLRLHLLDGVPLEALARQYDAHRSTVGRWIETARQRLVAEVRRDLGDRLGMGRADFDSLMRALTSQLDLSISQFLRTSAG
jgi:RNA polymerase sigma-70 factor, ECF subfamily